MVREAEVKRYISRSILKDARAKFMSHRNGAKRRSILFKFTFEDWWNLWWSSGHWFERGLFCGQYQMARYGDQGGYAVGNVRICTVEENRAEKRFTWVVWVRLILERSVVNTNFPIFPIV